MKTIVFLHAHKCRSTAQMIEYLQVPLASAQLESCNGKQTIAFIIQ